MSLETQVVGFSLLWYHQLLPTPMHLHLQSFVPRTKTISIAASRKWVGCKVDNQRIPKSSSPGYFKGQPYKSKEREPMFLEHIPS